MSNFSKTAFTTIDSSTLSHVVGGGGSDIDTSVTIPGTRRTPPVQLRLRGATHNTEWETCMATARRTAEEAYPDRRNPWEHLTNAVDPNAVRRAQYEREGQRMCGAPGHNS